MTPPLHGPNPRWIEGWHFRNSNNTGPNDVGSSNVNAPGERRQFVFSPENERDLSPEFIDRARQYGQGELTILEYDLSPVDPGRQAHLRSMRFEVSLRWAKFSP
jgi:hypothetical protein